MLDLPNYQIVTQIYESANSIIYRGIRLTDNKPVILKVLKEDYLTPAELTRYRQEYEITKDLDIAGVIKAYDIEEHQNLPVIIFEDFGGESLKDLLASLTFTKGKWGFPVSEFLSIAIQIADTLGQIHAANIIHKNINPANIVLNKTSKQLKIIDFGIASHLQSETLTLKNPEQLEGTLAYLSPEQTGRINRSMDYRTDLYSLGVTFYEMLSGQLPFEATNSMELVHCHIAKEPAVIDKVNTNVPPIISDIVKRLMAKNAEDRYQSAFCLKTDLGKCLELAKEAFDNKLVSAHFELGQDDFSGKFRIPQKLYGRKNEVKSLLQAFDRVSNKGTGEMMLVSGYSGVGKTALVREVHKPMTEKQGYFASGKFDQFQRNIPYFAISQVFNEFCNYLLTESAEHLNQWRENILKAVGKNGQVLIDVIPQLGLVIGAQPNVPHVGPQEAQNRFNLVFQNFFRAICQVDHPLVLFIDDLQWADSASLNLLKVLMTDMDSQYFLIIGAYRDNEVGESHPFIVTVNELQQTEAVINHIKLANLQPADVNLMLQESLLCNATYSQPLTDLVYDKTRGNAFFTRQFLQTLYDGQLLHFDFDQRQWFWNVEQITAQNITANVVSLMADKIDKVSKKMAAILQLAACIGNQFDLHTLAIISTHVISETSDVLALLWQAIKEGLVVPLNENYKLFEISETKPELVTFKFLHDRVQQAAYSLIPDDKKTITHLQTGRLLLESYTEPSELEEKLFDIVNHLNKGLALIDSKEERVKVAGLNLRAGKKARTSSAHQAAVGYFTVARDVLPDNAFQQYYNITFDVYTALAKSYYMANDFNSSEKLYPILLKSARSTMDKVRVHSIQMEDYHLQGDYEKAIQMQKAGLLLLGVNVPDDEGELDKLIEEELQQIPKYLKGRNIADLVNAPEMESEECKAMLQILISLWVMAYLVSRNTIVQWSSVKMCNLCLQHGNSDLASFAYLQYGFVCINRLQEYETGYQFGNVGLKVSDQYENLDIRGKVYFMFGLVINHWRKHVNLSTESFKKGYLFSVEAGDWTYAGYGAANIISNLLIDGHPCQNIYEEAQTYLNFLQNKASEVLNRFFTPGGFCALLNLLGETKDNSSFDCENLNEETFYKTYHDRPIVMGWFYTVKIRSLYWFRCYDEGANMIVQAETVAMSVPAQVKVPEAYFYSCLMLTAVDNQITDPEKKAYYWSLFDKYHTQMKIWAEHCPDNYQHKYLLVEAEKSRLLGKDVGTVLSLYEQAIQSAKAHHYPNNEALAHELTARFWLGQGNESYAKTHLMEALHGYQSWGATAKVKDLEAQYPQLLVRKIASAIPTISTTNMLTSTSELDLESVMQASQTLSGEMVLSRLLTRMMTIVIENAGADRGCLLLPQKENWFIEAEGRVNSTDVALLKSIAIEDSEQVSTSIINYVVRTRENLVLSNAIREECFNHDPYAIKHSLKSVLVMPLLNQGKLIGILYLENRLIEGAFTPQRLRLLNMISSQMGISIENSLLYNNLEQKVIERTMELQLEIAERKKAEEQIKASLKEKEVLLKEIHHRVKNNMQVISSLLRLQSEGIKDKHLLDIFDESRNRIKSMALIHEDLYSGKDLARIDFEQYTRKLTGRLTKSYGVDPNRIITSVNIDNVFLGVDKAIPCGLILNEFFTNSMKYAFPLDKFKDKKGEIRIDFHSNGAEHTLVFSDNGVGMPEDIDFQNPETMGLDLVNGLVAQLGGTVEIDRSNGTAFKINFKV